MRILLTNIRLHQPAGSEIWTWTVARELIRRNHQVFIWTAQAGAVAKALMNQGCRLIRQDKMPQKKFDIAIVNHSKAMNHTFKVIEKKAYKVILMSHGIFEPEMPVMRKGDKYFYVAVSKETASFRESQMGMKFKVIMNPVDPIWFKMPVTGNQLKRIFWGHYRWLPPEGLIQYCEKSGIEISGTNERIMPGHLINMIAGCDTVIGTGRYIYEGMAAGRTCIVADAVKTCGYVTPDNFFRLQNNNMTTRSELAMNIVTADEWGALFEQHCANGEHLRKIATKELHAEVIVDKLLRMNQ